MRPELRETFRHFWYLGLISFGGPSAHLGLLHSIFVERLQWLSGDMFSELFAICQALPGPASTQMVFVIALYKYGFSAAWLAFILWSVPGLLIMTVAAFLVALLPAEFPGWAHAIQNSLGSVAVGLIALASMKLSQSVLKSSLDKILAWASASTLMLFTRQYTAPLLILSGGFIETSVYFIKKYRFKENVEREIVADAHEGTDKEDSVELIVSPTESTESLIPRVNQNEDDSQGDANTDAETYIQSPDNRWSGNPAVTEIKFGLSVLFAWISVLIACFVLKEHSPDNAIGSILRVVCTCFITGSIIYGGGPVVVPLLYSYFVDPGWMTAQQFIFGMALINTLPGPNFNFAAYCSGLALSHLLADPNHVGSVIGYSILGSILGYWAIFVPGFAAKVAVIPLWKRFRRYEMFSVVLHGVATTAVGLVFAACYIIPEGAHLLAYPFYWCLSGLTFLVVGPLGLPAIYAVALCVLAGISRWTIHGEV